MDIGVSNPKVVKVVFFYIYRILPKILEKIPPLLSLYPSFALPPARPHFGIKANLAKARKINLDMVYCKSSCRC